MAMPFNAGEDYLHHILRVPHQDNPTATTLTMQASFMLQRSPLLALGTLDSQLRPWTTLWGGTTGFSEPLGGGLIGTRTFVDGKYDPVVQALVGDVPNGQMAYPKDGGKMIAGLTIDLMTRKRVKFAGRMIAGTMVKVEADGESPHTLDQVQMVTKVDQSLGNCPKYLNQYEVVPAIATPELASQGSTLSEAARALIAKSDLFFLSSSTQVDMDTNHRGGPQGFVRIMSSNEIVYPEYSGNRLYQSLGNLHLNPKIGMTFPDMEAGDVLYITGTTTILIGTDAAALLPGSNLAVKITIDEVHLVTSGLPFRATRKIPSAYNPSVRKLATEGNIMASVSGLSNSQKTAHLTKKEVLTPSIARFTFQVPEGIHYAPGQWLALDLKAELDIGYEHMRDSDPLSLNDDFVRTFTISSAPNTTTGQEEQEFEVTFRKVGPVTGFLFQQNERAGVEVKVLGVGGDFRIRQQENLLTPFIAGGVGITPLLGQLQELDLSRSRLRVLWTLKASDVDLVVDVLTRHPGLAECVEVFLTGNVLGPHVDRSVLRLRDAGVKVENRRLAREDLDTIDAATWYMCAGKLLRVEILAWLTGKTVVYEDFDY